MDRFFITGCQRSGTTLLRLILDSHPNIHCFDEAYGYEFLIRETKNNYIEPLFKENAIYLGFKVPRFTEQLTWTEFSDPDYGVFSTFYNNQKVIHIFRNVLDVVASMINLRTTHGVSWMNRYGLSILGSMIQNPEVRSFFNSKYLEIQRQGMPFHLSGALYWIIKNKGYYDLLRLGKPVLAVKYESLVSYPKPELIKISDFLDINWDEALLNHPKYFHDGLEVDGTAIGNTDPSRNIDANSIGKHRLSLSKNEIEDIEFFVKDIEFLMFNNFMAY